MSRVSTKQRLIDEMTVRILDSTTSRADKWAWENMRHDLQKRGSGPLPFWARELARGWFG